MRSESFGSAGPRRIGVALYDIVTRVNGVVTFRATSTVESVDVPAPVYWFPKRQEFRRETDGKAEVHEVSNFVLKSINEAIPNSAFDIANFGLPAGTRVVGLPKSGIKVWDGTALVDESLYTPPPAPESVSAEAARGAGGPGLPMPRWQLGLPRSLASWFSVGGPGVPDHEMPTR